MNEPEIVQKIIHRFYQKEEVDDEMLFWLLDYIAKTLVEDQDDTQFQFCEYLQVKLNRIWQYGQYKQMTTQQSYLYGGAWGALKVLEFIRDERIRSQEKYALATQYEKETRYTFLSSLYNNPGLQNKDLAQICGVTSARISQIANEALSDRVISVQEFGNEKCYFLRNMGECIYEYIHKQKERLSRNHKVFNYKMMAFSNEEIDFEAEIRKINLTLGKLSRNNRVFVAIAFAPKPDDIDLKSIHGWIQERNDDLWLEGMNSLSANYGNFWKLQKGVDMINQL